MDSNEMKQVIATTLEANGFHRDVAGDEDFAAVGRAILSVCEKKMLGIVFQGKAGSGKTLAAGIACKCFQKLIPEHDFPWDVVDCFNPIHVESMDRWDTRHDVLLDDMGADAACASFGNRRDYIAEFILRWWKMCAQYRTQILLITTNLDGVELESRYGTRVIDQFATTCAICKLNGESHRTALPWK